MEKLTHFNEEGRARMVDVSEKATTLRTATATGAIYMDTATLAMIREGRIKKGDVLAVAQVAGIMAAKRTSELIPMCHPLALTGADIRFALHETPCRIEIGCTTRCKGETGVEMEALCGVSAAALTIYDMCKAIQRDMRISDIQLLHKSGGKSGEYHREDTSWQS